MMDPLTRQTYATTPAEERVAHRGALQSLQTTVVNHPWATLWTAIALVVTIMTLGYMLKGRDAPAIPIQDGIPAGLTMPTVVEMKDGKSGCTVRLYYDGDRLVSVLAGQKRNGELDCPGT